MKRILSAMMILVALFVLSSCGKQTDAPQTSSTKTETIEATELRLYAPRSAKGFRWMDQAQAETDLRKAGFQSIELKAMEDITSNCPISDGAVESVEINGDTKFSTDTAFPEDAKVKIEFHRIPRLEPPVTSEEAAAFEYLNVGERFFKAGFTNVLTSEQYDLEPGSAPQTEVTANDKPIVGDGVIFDSPIKVIGHFPYAEYNVQINIDFPGNLFFSKYDVDVELDGKGLGTLLHGQGATYDLKLPDGKYTLTFTSTENSNAKGSVALDIQSDTQLTYRIDCYSDKVSIDLDSKTQTLKENMVKLPYSHQYYLRKDCGQVVSDLKKLGFSDIKTEESAEKIWGPTPAESVVGITIAGNPEFRHDEIVDLDSKVTVFYHACNFAFKETEVTVTEKDGFEVPYTMTSDENLDMVSFVIDDEGIVKDAGAGHFIALVPGQTRITAVSGGKICAQCTVIVNEIVVPIEKLTMTAEEMNISAGSSFKVDYAYEPETANYTDVKIEISSPVVEQCEDGTYYAAEAGDAEILFSQDERILAVCKVHAEKVDVEELTLGDIPEEIVMGETADLSFSLKPENATNLGISVKSSDPKIAEVTFDERGPSTVKIAGMAGGKTEIVIKLPDGTEYKQPVIVKEILPDELKVELQNPDQTIQVGTPIQPVLTWMPEETSVKEVVWQSSNPGVLKINPDGAMEAVGVGQATLTARHKSGAADTLQIEVQATPVERIEISTDYDGEDFVKGNKMTLIATVYPENATDKSLQWSSSDTTVLTVNNQGVVTAVGEGGAVITAESKNGVKGVYPMGANPAPQKYAITWSLTPVSNDHVGGNWTKGCELNGASCNTGSTMTFAPGEEITINLWVQENDSRPDEDAYFTKLKLSEEIRKNGFIEEGELYVTENGGRYSGNQAIWKFKFSMKPVNW